MTDQTADAAAAAAAAGEKKPEGAPAAAAAAAQPAPLDAATRQTFYKSLTPDNLQFAERNGFYKPDGSHLADPNVIVESYRNADKLMGAARLPEPDLSNKDALAKWPGWQKLGVVEDPKQVQIKRAEMPAGMQYDEAGENRLRERLVQGRVPGYLHQEIYDAEVNARLAEAKANNDRTTQERTRIETTLRKELGADYDGARARALEALNYAAEKSGVDPKRLADSNAVLLGDESMVRMFMWLGNALGEDVIKGGKNSGFASGPAAAQRELDGLKNDPEHRKAASERTHPGHKAAVEREERLNKIIHGG